MDARRWVVASALALFLLGGCRGVPMIEADEVATPVGSTRGDVRLEARAGWRGGPVRGHLQTPDGGQPGTTSPDRPRLSEIGVSWGNELHAELSARWRRHEAVLGGSWLFLRGDGTLTEALITQGDPYPAGTDVESDSAMAFLTAAYRYDLPVRLDDCGGCLHVKPGVGASFFRLEYLLDGDNGESADRSYSHVAPHLEATLQWRPGGPRSRVDLELHARQTLPFLLPDSKQVDLFELRARARYALTGSLGLALETGFRHLGFEDDQTVPNELDVDFGPWVGLTVDLRL